MKNARTFCFIIISCAVVVVGYNALVWNLCNKKLLSRQEGIFTGDLARLGYLSAYAYPRKNTVDLPKEHLELDQYQGQPIDLITVGDSFSQGVGNGHNRYYQDYLASHHNLSVLNLGGIGLNVNLIDQILILLNSGYFERIQPSKLILEIVERNCYKYSKTFDFSRTLTLKEVETAVAQFVGQKRKRRDESDIPEVAGTRGGVASSGFPVENAIQRDYADESCTEKSELH